MIPMYVVTFYFYVLLIFHYCLHFSQDQVTIENQQDGTLGLSLSVAGLYVQAVCEDLPVKSGCPIEPGNDSSSFFYSGIF